MAVGPEAAGSAPTPGSGIGTDADGTSYLLGEAALRLDHVQSIAAHPDPTTAAWVLTVELDLDDADALLGYTTAHVGEQVAIALGSRVLVAPVISEPLGGALSISGGFTEESIADLYHALVG